MRRIRPGRQASLLLVAVLLIAAFLTASCGQDGKSAAGGSPAASVGTPSPAGPGVSPEVCAAAAQLRQSVSHLLSLNVVDVGRNGLEAAAAEVRADLKSLQSGISSAYQQDVRALREALDDLEAAVTAIPSGTPYSPTPGTTTPTPPSVRGALAEISATTMDLWRNLQAGCPTLTTSPTSSG